MPTLADLFTLDPNVERLTLLPRLRGSLPSEKSVMMPDRYMPDIIAPKILYDFIRAIKAPARAARGEALNEEEALNVATNLFGGGLATSGSVPLGALGMSARTAPAGSIPLREVPRSPLGFYSKVEEATLPLQNKGSGSQFLAQIQKTPGVKPEEIEVLGLDKFLQSKPTVTKQEVQDYITANKPDVQEMRLDNAKTLEREKLKNESFKALEQVDQAIPNLSQLNRANLTTFWAPGAQAGNVNDLAKIQALNLSESQMEAVMNYGAAVNRQRDFIESSNGYMAQPKFASYTIPGGENYREILLTLPTQDQRIAGRIGSARLTSEEGSRFRELETLSRRGEANQSQIDELNRLEQRVAESQTAFADARRQDPRQDFISTHFDQPNILTHLRANDRVIDGKKALFIEEIQSDWHQAGRKKGYGPQTETTHEAYYTTPDGRRVLLGFGKTQEEAAAAVDPRWKSVVDVKFDTQTRKVSEGVPDAPFKKSWHELALKRAIQEAVDKGYDKLAFTTGKTQAERYDLSKQVDELLYKKNPDGTYRLSAQVRGRGQSFGDSIPEFKLEEYVGKEVAKSITQGSGKDVNLGGPGSFTQPRDDWKSMSGLDLQVGGEGMKGFYDEILPKALQNLTKKYGTKVTKTTMKAGQDVTEPGIVAPGVGMEFAGKTTKAPEVEVWSMDITPQMREQVKAKGQPLFATAPPLGLATQDPLEQFLGYQEAQNDPLMQFLGYK